MPTSVTKLVNIGDPTKVKDEILLSLAEAVSDPFRGEKNRNLSADSDCPFDLEVAAPRALDVHKLYKLWYNKVPPEIEAALGPRFAIMLCHGITPFYRPGYHGVGVASLGYSIKLQSEKSNCVTASVFPESKLVETGIANVTLGLDASGALSIPHEALEVSKTAAGLTIGDASINATTNVKFGIAIKCAVSLLKVQAGPVGAGGARWNIYKSGQRIDVNHTLLHTLLVPEGTKTLHVRIDSWVRQPRRWLGVLTGIEWSYPPVEYDVSLEGG